MEDDRVVQKQSVWSNFVHNHVHSDVAEGVVFFKAHCCTYVRGWAGLCSNNGQPPSLNDSKPQRFISLMLHFIVN
jgi:hypothetical protein